MSAMKRLLEDIIAEVNEQTGLSEENIEEAISEMYDSGLVRSSTWSFDAQDVVRYINSKAK